MRIEDVKDKYYKSAYGPNFAILTLSEFTADVVQALMNEFNITEETAIKVEDIIWDGFSNEMYIYFQMLQNIGCILNNVRKS